MISTRDLQSLPGIPELKRLTQSLALLDAIIEPDWELRYYSFDAHWNSGEARGNEATATEAMASMRNGEGDHYFLLFNDAGAILKGFAHESIMAPARQTPPRPWPGVLDSVPAAFSSFLAEPAFSIADTTFCIWRTHADTTWQRGDIHFPDAAASDAEDPDGSETLLAILDGTPRTYREWAQEYYERPIDLAAVTHIYEHRPLTEEIVRLLNDDLGLDDVAEDAREIGY